MRISFDIDNTLIPYVDDFEVTPVNIFWKLIGVESLREGTKELFQTLQNQGHEIWIYTSSHRSLFSLKKTFLLNGLNPKGYINGKRSEQYLKKYACDASKNPKLFGIDLHVDDSEGVRMEGNEYEFETIIVHPKNKNWVTEILQHIETL